MPEASFYILIPCIKEEIDQPWISIQTTHIKKLSNPIKKGQKSLRHITKYDMQIANNI